MVNPVSWIGRKLGIDRCSKRRRYMLDTSSMDCHPPSPYMHHAEFSPFPPPPPDRLHSPHHRDAFPDRGILRYPGPYHFDPSDRSDRSDTSDTSDAPDWLDMPNSGVQGRRSSATNTPYIPAQSVPLVPPDIPQPQPQPHAVSFPCFPLYTTPVYQFPDSGTFTPNYVVPGTLSRPTPTGPSITPVVLAGLLPISVLHNAVTTPYMQPHAMPAAPTYPSFPMPHTPATPTSHFPTFPTNTPAAPTSHFPTFPMHTPTTPFSAPPTPMSMPQVPQQWRTVEVCATLALPIRGGPPSLAWDLWRLPSSALRRSDRGNIYRLTDADLRSPVTLPAADSITITCRTGAIADFWPEINVRGSPVTIEKILDDIYQHFHTEVNEVEYMQILEMDTQNAKSVVDTMHERCKLANELFENAWRVGLKRIDCLGDKHHFKDLRVEYSGNESWKLELKLGPR